MALGTLILNAFSVRTAPGRLIRCRCSAIQNNVQANTYDLRRPGATRSLLSSLPNQSISRDLRPNSRQVMPGIVDSGPEGGHGKADANDPLQTSSFDPIFCIWLVSG